LLIARCVWIYRRHIGLREIVAFEQQRRAIGLGAGVDLQFNLGLTCC